MLWPGLGWQGAPVKERNQTHHGPQPAEQENDFVNALRDEVREKILIGNAKRLLGLA